MLNEKGYKIGHNVAAGIPETLGYGLRMNQKMLQIGEEHPERNTPFEFINGRFYAFILSGGLA